MLLRSLPLAPGYTVADEVLGEDVGGVLRVVAQLALEVLHYGAHRPGASGMGRPRTRCRISAWIITRPALTASSKRIWYSMSMGWLLGCDARFARLLGLATGQVKV